MIRTLFTNGTVLDATGSRAADVLVDADSGVVEAVGVGLDPAGCVVVDVTGCVVSPGFVDLATHLREPGHEAAETIRSASMAAASGGYTAVVAMPDTEPCLDSSSTLAMVHAAAHGAQCEIVPAGAISVGRRGIELAPIGELADLGVRVFTDNDLGVQDPRFLRRAFEYANSIEAALVLMQRGVVAELAAETIMHEGTWSVLLGVGGQPALAEDLLVQRDLALAELTNGRLHVQISTAGSVASVRRAKDAGVRVTASVAPHHFSLTDHACAGYDPRFRIDPPLRTADDLDAVRAGMADGTIDAIATSHEPHTQDAKERPFDQAPTGVIGLETALGIALADSGLSLVDLLPLLSWGPAAIAGVGDRHGRPIVAGEAANLTIIDPEHEWTVTASTFASKATNTPFEGRTLKGKVRHTVFQGKTMDQTELATTKTATTKTATTKTKVKQ